MMTQVTINIVDSRDDNKLAYIVVDGCKVPIFKVKLNDLCYVMKLVDNVCHIELDYKECERSFKK